jgi:hypothetical protein
MKVTGDPVSLDPNDDAVLFEPKDWRVCGNHFGIMHHLPTGDQYYVQLPQVLRLQLSKNAYD